MSATIPTTIRALRRWIEPVLKTIGQDEFLPILSHARLEVGPRHALLLATDRFAASMSRVRWDDKHPAADPMTVHIHRDALKRILSTFPAPRGRVDPELSVEVTEDRVRFDGPLFAVDVPTLEHRNETAPVPSRHPVQFPDIKRLFRDAAEAKGEGFAGPMGVNFHRLADFRVAASKHEATVIEQAPGGMSRPYIIRPHDDYLGLLMPRRLIDPDTTPPPITEGWDDALATPKEKA